MANTSVHKIFFIVISCLIPAHSFTGQFGCQRSVEGVLSVTKDTLRTHFENEYSTLTSKSQHSYRIKIRFNTIFVESSTISRFPTDFSLYTIQRTTLQLNLFLHCFRFIMQTVQSRYHILVFGLSIFVWQLIESIPGNFDNV